MSRVLIVDDTAVVARVIAAALTLEGHECVEVTGDFPQLFTQEPWDGVEVLVCDVRLAGMLTGTDVLRYCRTYRPDVYRIAISASFDMHDLITRQAHQAAHVFLKKPDDMADLAAAVKERVR